MGLGLFPVAKVSFSFIIDTLFDWTKSTFHEKGCSLSVASLMVSHSKELYDSAG